MTRLPEAAPSSTVPFSSTRAGLMPKNGRVAEPGLSLVARGSGVIRMPPVAVVIVEHVLVRERGEDEIAAARVQHALGLTGGAGGVEDEQRVLRAHLDGSAVGVDLHQLLVQPDIPAGAPGHG